MINVGRSGFMCTGRTITADHLQQMRAVGVMVVISCIEYGKPCISESPAVVEQWDELFKQANHIVFVDEYDKVKAVEKSPIVKSYDNAGKVSIICIPATLKELRFEQLRPVTDREPNFLNFGMIRQNKGIVEYALPFAEKLRAIGSGKKVLIVGSVMHDSVNPELVATILMRCYAQTKGVKQDLGRILDQDIDLCEKAEVLLSYYRDNLKHKNADINVELHFDVAEIKLQALFDRCRYALNFHYKGISPHFGGVTNTLLAQMKNYDLHQSMTPDYFLEGGKYRALAKAYDPRDKNAMFDGILADTNRLKESVNGYAEFTQTFAKFNSSNPIDIFSVSAAFNSVYKHISLEDTYRRATFKGEMFTLNDDSKNRGVADGRKKYSVDHQSKSHAAHFSH